MEKYKKIRHIGRGAHGIVYLYSRISDGHEVIMKEILVDQMSSSERQASLTEVKVLSMLNHPNIIAHLENFLEEKSIFIIMEYAKGGTLYDYIQEREAMLFTEKEVLHMFAQLVLALQYVHAQNILHRDLKSQNILLNESRTIAKIGDFGISKILSSKSKASTVVGTPHYISPELCECKPYNQKSDIWALGCILYEMLCLRRPFEGDNIPALVMKIMKGNFEPIPVMYSREVRQLVMSMLCLDPGKRPSVAQIMAQPFMLKHLYNLYMNLGSMNDNFRSVNSTGEAVDQKVLSSQLSEDGQKNSVDIVSKVESGLILLRCGSRHAISLPLSFGTCIKMVSICNDQKVGVTNNGQIILWQSSDDEIYSSIDVVEGNDDGIKSLICGNNFTVYITDSGVIYTFGKGASGCLGHSEKSDVYLPKIVKALFEFTITSVSCGLKHVLAVTDEGNIFAWGYGNYGCVGLGKAEYIPLPHIVTITPSRKITKVFCGTDCSFAITDSKILLACGSNRHNKLAMDTEDGHHVDEARVFTPVCSDPLPRLKIQYVAAGSTHTAILTDDGMVYTTGSNKDGQLGWGDLCLTHNMPGIVDSLSSLIVSKIACGDTFTVALTSDLSLFAWGMFPDVLNPTGSAQVVKVSENPLFKGKTVTDVSCHGNDCAFLLS